MDEVSFPLVPGMQGDAVAVLHAALQHLLDERRILKDDEAARLQARADLRDEVKARRYGEATARVVAIFQKENRIRTETPGHVDRATADAINRVLEELDRPGGEGPAAQDSPPWVVKGTLRFFDGIAAAGLRVSAFDRDLRNEQFLNEGRSGRDGTYRIEYDAASFERVEKAFPDLVVKVLNEEGKALVASPILFNAPPVATIDVIIPADALLPPSLFERIHTALLPLLHDLRIADLEQDKQHDDLVFLVGETGFTIDQLARFVLAHRLQSDALPAEFWFALLGGPVFTYNESQSLTTQHDRLVPSLRTLDAPAVRKQLVRGFNAREIPAGLRKNIEPWINAFLRLIARQALSDPKDEFLKQALDDAKVRDEVKQESFVRLFQQHGGVTPDLLKSLEEGGEFSKSEIADLHTSFILSDFTRGDFTTVRALKEELRSSEPARIRDLAKKSESEWFELIDAKHRAGELNLPFETKPLVEKLELPGTQTYAAALHQRFRDAYPTAAFAGGLERALNNGGVGGIGHAQALGQFLNRHEDFELMHTPIDAFLDNDADPISRDPAFRRELKSVQRVFKLAPSFDATDTLLADNVHSAQQIYRKGQSEFVREYSNSPGFTTQSAQIAWNRAADTYAAALTVLVDVQSLDPAFLPVALNNGNEDVSTFPNWNTLFKTGDMCECEHCRSVLSPAAYFADLLMFLKDRDSTTAGIKVKDLLFARRPDLGYIELNCPNALTPFPYVDTVCEVLEAVVADGDNDLELLGFTTMPAVNPEAAVLAAFDAEDIDLGTTFTLSQVDPTDPDRWIVHGEAITYLLKKKATPNFFAEVLRNTKATAAELRAYPQYVNPVAYETLATVRYPMTLPFGLFAEEVRAAFQKTNLQRWDLMRTLHGAAPPNNPSDSDIAAEYFGIAIEAAAAFDEKRLILNADATIAGQQALWGESGGAWLTRVGNVKLFLQKTRLEYTELLALLDLSFVNPGGVIVINHLDASCDTDQKVLQGLNATRLDRIHRFLRLWRKLAGWKMWELDLVIRHPRIGNGSLDQSFLVRLFYFSQIKKRLGTKVTVEQVCALFADLNIETRFTALFEKREDALYQNLFQNRLLTFPLDPAFAIDSATGDIAPGETMSAHHPVIIAALGIRETDLVLLKALTRASDGAPYINDDLTLANLSFLWRHAWLSKTLKYTVEDWVTLLKVFDLDVPDFGNPQTAWNRLEQIDRLKSTGFTVDQLDWILAAAFEAESATTESDAALFLAALRKEIQAIEATYDPAQYAFLTAVPPTDVDALSALLTSVLAQLHRDEAATQFFISTLRDEIHQQTDVAGMPLAFVFPAAITGAPNNIRIRFDDPTLHFDGVMTDAQRTTLLTDPSLAAVTGLPDYQQAINSFFTTPRLALKFFDPVFEAPLENLPEAVDFNALADPLLILKITYDAEQRLLRFIGIMTTAEQDALNALSADLDYLTAVNSLATQPALIAPPDPRIWLLDADLLFPLRDLVGPANDNLASNLATALSLALPYLSRTLSEGAVVVQAAAQLELTEDLTRTLLTEYGVLPDTLLEHLTTTFAAAIGVIDYATLKSTFDGWYWAMRTASVWKTWKITLEEFERLLLLTVPGQLIDFATLPLDDTQPIGSLENLLRGSRLLMLRDSTPETYITLLEVLEKLDGGEYATSADFAADVELLNEEWLATDVEALVAALDIAYPAGYLLAENLERLRRAFYFLDALNATTVTALPFAETTMSFTHAQSIKELLRAKFGTDTWLALSAEIQDVLRERKRDALSAYLLTQPQPADAPTGKWENTNDLYAYYLLDVEMCSCMLTSRVVQGSGSIQLFVQRCFMGLEPEVLVDAEGDDGDSAWRWWEWMSKYRVWEANRKVFLWPENWIEPELNPDRSPFFKSLESDLQQNEINEYSVETAFINYLEKLNGVAQLDIAGFYQEDDGDNTIIHVFGRSVGVEPRLYYYRRYDYRIWTPWERVDLDIQGDYLIPMVVNKRLFLAWPVFTEIQDEESNSESVPIPTEGDDEAEVKKTKKMLRLQMAVSDYRNGKWTPRRISIDFDESGSYEEELVRKHYNFYVIDRTEIDGRFVIKYEGYSANREGYYYAGLFGAFELSGCKGVPEITDVFGYFTHALRPEENAVGDETVFHKWREIGPFPERLDAPENDFTLHSNVAAGYLTDSQILVQTPWIFRMAPPWHLSLLDRMFLDGLFGLGLQNNDSFYTPVGTWLPFFYNDKRRTFFVLPTIQVGGDRGSANSLTYIGGGGGVRYYYPEIKQFVNAVVDLFAAVLQNWIDNFDLGGMTAAEREQLEEQLAAQFPDEPVPPYTDEQVKDLSMRWAMRFLNFYVAMFANYFFQYRQFHFKNFYHPFVCKFAELVYNPLEGVPGLMRRETQLLDSGFSFDQSYRPTLWVVDPSTEEFYPRENVDFSPDGAYASYNWELFFHAPLLIANSLSANQRFEEAREWYHFIFNPIGLESSTPGGSAMSKYWITKPFFETTDPQYIAQRIENLMLLLAAPGTPTALKQALEAQVLDWRDNPFEPHRIANYRTVAYQKTVVMKYLDNLIAWGDNLFRQDSMESINEATQLYILAAEILGPKPMKIPPQAQPPVESFNELEHQFDDFSNALIEIENLVPAFPGNPGADPASLPMLYFCIPYNEKLLGYWDTVADRLYKVRHCMNIEGVVRTLALFEPPIDPGALVKAVAGGMDISSALADLNAPLPLYRFPLMLQKANEVCNDVKAFGAALLSALEKKDAEALGLLRQGQEIQLLEALKTVREKQIDEAKAALEALKKNKELAQIRKTYYESRAFMNAAEIVAMVLNTASTIIDIPVSIGYIAAGVLKLIPNFLLGASGFGGSPHATAETGGSPFGDSAKFAAEGLGHIARNLDKMASLSSTVATYLRRQEEWNFQKDLAVKEIEQIDESIAGAEVRIDIAEKELANQALQIDNSKAVDTFMRNKYTNQELYQWQIAQISGVFFQSYRLAYDLAKRAERCFRFELGLQESSYINFGYWDSLKKGLMSGERLQYDLRRLESAWMEQNRREYELTKHVSLAQIDPLALILLRETGRCFFRVPEELFDLDFPGHYFRRIKSVSLTLPCVAGPYTTVPCTLRLLKNSMRINTANGDNGYRRNTDDQGLPTDDTRFVESNIPVKSIAGSSAQNDAGVFELNYRDERYLPFEGAGAISEWALELFSDLPANNPDPNDPDYGFPLRQFDYGSITDAVLHIRYTAREDAGPFKNDVINHLREHLDGAVLPMPAMRLFNLRQEFPAQWHRFLNPADAALGNVFELPMMRTLFPLRDQERTLRVTGIWLLARCTDGGDYDATLTAEVEAPGAPVVQALTLGRSTQFRGIHIAVQSVDIEVQPDADPSLMWQFAMTRPGGGNLQPDPVAGEMEVSDMMLVIGYEWA